jgi:hypothetical protein
MPQKQFNSSVIAITNGATVQWTTSLDLGLLSLQHRSLLLLLLIRARTLSWLEINLPVSIISHEAHAKDVCLAKLSRGAM